MFGPEYDVFPKERSFFELKARFRNLTKEMMRRIPDVLVEIAEQVHYDVDNTEPKIPVRTGAMRKSKTITKKSDRHVRLSYGGKSVPLDDGTIKDVYYAAEVHEGLPDLPQPINWTRGGSGPHFLLTKIDDEDLKKKWMGVAIREFKDVLKGL